MTRLRREQQRYQHEPREATMRCQCCEQDFVDTITTKPKKYCATCRKIKREEERVRSNLAKAKRDKPVAALKPMRKLVPYAGYVEKEHRTETIAFYKDFRK